MDHVGHVVLFLLAALAALHMLFMLLEISAAAERARLWCRLSPSEQAHMRDFRNVRQAMAVVGPLPSLCARDWVHQVMFSAIGLDDREIALLLGHYLHAEARWGSGFGPSDHVAALQYVVRPDVDHPGHFRREAAGILGIAAHVRAAHARYEAANS